MREFTNYLTVKDMKYLDLFDEIPHKYIKNLQDDNEIEVNTEDIETDAFCFKTSFEFELEINKNYYTV